MQKENTSYQKLLRMFEQQSKLKEAEFEKVK